MILQQFMFGLLRERGERKAEEAGFPAKMPIARKGKIERGEGCRCRCRPGCQYNTQTTTTMTDLWEPTLTQQRALAYAPKPLAFISLISSSIVIYHLGCRRKQKLRRMYHRLILAMSIVDLPFAVSWIWGNWVRV